ncbi:MAG: hypothetical protein FJW56_08815 [Actinobacteria bacterium]|nr:hypothetical protein [Actinomycetota bacterium]
MNQKNIDALIPVAVNYLSKDKKNKVVENGKVVEKEYSSYLDSFGPTILQTGMMKALTVYGRKEGDAKRYVIDNLVKQVLLSGKVLDEKYKDKDNYLIDIYFEEIERKNFLERLEFEDRILEGIVACKLALQLFKIVKKEEAR